MKNTCKISVLDCILSNAGKFSLIYFSMFCTVSIGYDLGRLVGFDAYSYIHSYLGFCYIASIAFIGIIIGHCAIAFLRKHCNLIGLVSIPIFILLSILLTCL